MRILCIGRSGQTAQALRAAAGPAGVTLLARSSSEADLGSPASLGAAFDAARPDAVINAGAYNHVDRAETEEAEARRVNADGPAFLARRCREAGTPFIHMSTDLVFDGRKAGAYSETDAVSPLSAYGRSKADGEARVLAEDPSALVTRVCWVFSGHGSNFVTRMIELARRQDRVRVVCDQVGAPTYAPDIARLLLDAARRMREGGGPSGLMHVSAEETFSRDEMARRIFAASRAMGGPFAEVEPVTTAAFAAPALRPLNAHLCARLARSSLGFTPTAFSDALARSLEAILRPASGWPSQNGSIQG